MKKSWRGAEISLAVVLCHLRVSLDVTPFNWRRWLFAFQKHWLVREEHRNLHVYLGPFHLWTMNSGTQFAVELEFGYDRFWNEVPTKESRATSGQKIR